VQAVLPSLEHLHMADYDNVYEPADDTFLRCDALEQDRAFLSTQLCPEVVLEIGSGSGCVITFLAMLLRDEGVKACQAFAIDINPAAASVTQRTARANGVSVVK
jgi:release factor glutamine methyltransferase